jgi:phosphonate degradation associated HDIG domain protein
MNPPQHPGLDIVRQIEELFDQFGHGHYDGARAEPVSARAHALQCAQLAEWADAPETLVVAALLHDIGHFIAPNAAMDAIDDVHELRALGFLASGFGAEVIEPIRLHVQAKRYLVAVDPPYAQTLSPASVHTLRLQGGAMSPDEVNLFATLPHAAQAVSLRRWDDRAKTPGRLTASLDYYLTLVEAVRTRPFEAPRTVIGAHDIA